MKSLKERFVLVGIYASVIAMSMFWIWRVERLNNNVQIENDVFVMSYK